ncbi:hypothetical protein [Lapillicoccus sp.]|uniref:hypothetical protein n=1 Tax=Lapillicoccus sp. TaxID=1909287 RepID=UPI0032647464
MTLHDIYPAFALEISGGSLSLRGLRSEDLPAVGELAVGGIHGPDFLLFLFPSSEAAPDKLSLNTARFY